jgi:tRNA-modifying protein YgfZ
MGTDWNLIELADLGVLRLRGADAVRFLQGQVSNDVEKLSAERSQLAGYHNPQGRAIALLRLVQLGADDLLAILPSELTAPVASRLAKFILRAKVKIADESSAWRLRGLVAPDSGPVQSHTVSALLLPDSVHSQSRSGETIIVRVGATPARWLVISPAGETTLLSGCASADRDAWRLLDIADGLPQVYAGTSEEFVAQMLNLDALGAIAFDKGCYTGQEVIARAHYRGRVKRRMQRFLSREPARLAVGDSGQLADGRSFKVVEAAVLANGRCEFLAVAPMVASAANEGAAEPGEAGGTATAAATHPTPLDAEILQMSYPLLE